MDCEEEGSGKPDEFDSPEFECPGRMPAERGGALPVTRGGEERKGGLGTGGGGMEETSKTPSEPISRMSDIAGVIFF